MEELEAKKAADAQERLRRQQAELEEKLRAKRLKESAVREAVAHDAEQTRAELEQRQQAGEERRK